MFAALLHPVDRVDWLAWTVHPSTVVGIAALGGLYWWARRTRAKRPSRPGSAGAATAVRESRGPTPAQTLSFASGLIVLFAALNGPIHDLSDYYLFSAHMVQHLLLTLLVTPLLIAGTPGWMLRPLLRVSPVAAAARAVTGPAACFVVFNVTVVAWHLPPLYNLAMADHRIHIVQHLSFLVASTLMWWPLLSPLPELPRLSYPQQMLYTFLLMLPMSVLGIYLTYADRLLYPAYESAPRIWGISPLEDQLIGGLIMWILGGMVLLGVASVVFFRWSATHDDGAGGEVEARSTPHLAK